MCAIAHEVHSVTNITSEELFDNLPDKVLNSRHFDSHYFTQNLWRNLRQNHRTLQCLQVWCEASPGNMHIHSTSFYWSAQVSAVLSWDACFRTACPTAWTLLCTFVLGC